MCVVFTLFAILASQGDTSKAFKIVDEKCEKEGMFKRKEKTTQTMSAWVKEVRMPQNL